MSDCRDPGDMPAPVIISSVMNSYGLVRAFGEKGVKSILTDRRWGPAKFSKYVSECWHLPSAYPTDAAIERLLQHASRHDRPMMLIPCNEPWVVAIMDRREEFEKYFAIPLAKTETARLALTKTDMHQWCLRNDIRVPTSFSFGVGEDWLAFLRSLEGHFPVIVKPETKGVGDESLGFTTRVFQSMDELLDWGRSQGGGPSCAVLCQHFVSGSPRSLVAYHGYRTADGRTFMAGLTKLRIQPPVCGGSTSAGYIRGDEGSRDAALDVLKKLEFTGLFDIEFIREPSTGLLYFIELNPRPGMPNYGAAAVGVNFPYIACLDQVGMAPSKSSIVIDGTGLWINSMTDFIAYVFFYRSIGKGMSLRNWWRSVRGQRIVDVYFNREDPHVFLAGLRDVLCESFRHLGPMLMRKLKRS